MNGILYNSFESKLIRNENIAFVKLLVEREIKNYKYNINDESISEYINHCENKNLYNTIQKYNISDSELTDIRSSILKSSKYNLEIEYLPTEDWEFAQNKKVRELILTLPSYEMLSDALALFILVFPFAALFLSYFLIMIFR